jgi:hypothetical protein
VVATWYGVFFLLFNVSNIHVVDMLVANVR